MRSSFLILLVFLLNCTQKPNEEIKNQKPPIIVFSHNLHGELEICGCRKKPLGGMVQAAGLFENLKSQHPNQEILYFDTGDSLYPTGQIPEVFLKSHHFAASHVMSFFKDLKITAFLPGDQDLTFGYQNLIDRMGKSRVPILLSNTLEQDKHIQKYLIHEMSHMVIYFVGVLEKNLLTSDDSLLIESETAIKEQVKEINKIHGERFPAKQKMMILLSHSGMRRDKELATKFPEFSWIIGAHSQSFTQLPEIVGKTQIVQVLSRNHHMGVIDLSKIKNSFKTIELNDLFSEYDGNTTWKKRYEKYQTELKSIKESELDSIGN